MKKTNKFINALLLGALALAPVKQAISGVSGNLEGIFSSTKENTYARLNAFYNIPFKIGGYSFMELYQDGNGYFGKTMLTRPLNKDFSGKLEIEHINDPFTSAGIGLQVQLKNLPPRINGKLEVLPVYIDDKGKPIKKRKVLGGSVFVDFGDGFELFGWGKFNTAANKWEYGELELNKSLGKGIKIGYNPALMPQGKPAPKVEHRAKIQVNF